MPFAKVVVIIFPHCLVAIVARANTAFIYLGGVSLVAFSRCFPLDPIQCFLGGHVGPPWTFTMKIDASSLGVLTALAALTNP